MMHSSIENIIDKFAEILDRAPLDQMEDTHAILRKFTQALAIELGEMVANEPERNGVRMYFDEKIARYVIKKHVGL